MKDNVWTMDKGERKIVLIIHNVRSAHNAGSLLRTADGFGIQWVIFSGYTPYPKQANDNRLPHIADKVSHQIQKTALGAEDNVSWSQVLNLSETLVLLKKDGFDIAILEQTTTAININDYSAPDKIALVVGNEVRGIEAELRESIKTHLEIPMLGTKESFNVSVAGAIALYRLRYS